MTAGASGVRSPVPGEEEALRLGIGVTPLPHVSLLRMSGAGAFALLDRLTTAPLFLREGELRQTLLLDEAGCVFSDAIVASDESGYLLMAEGPSEAELLAHVDRHRPAGLDVLVTSLSASHELVGLNGPYAWELASALLGPAVLGMSYLSLLSVEEVTCFRAGRTGEYGYDLLIPRERGEHWRAELERRGAPLGARAVGLAALDLAALESWHYCIRNFGPDLGPIELQLQWRLKREPTFVGLEALSRRRAAGVAGRATAFTAASPVAAGDPVFLGEERLGQVLVAAWSSLREQVVGVALLDLSFAHPGIDAFEVARPQGRVAITTRTPPLVNNRSLYVDPHRHGTATRSGDRFPPLVLP